MIRRWLDTDTAANVILALAVIVGAAAIVTVLAGWFV